MKILIVDDEGDITSVLQMALEKHGFGVTIYNDPIAALSNFGAGVYDLILLDIRMPKMDGFKLYEEINKIDGMAKVCFMTAFEVFITTHLRIYSHTLTHQSVSSKSRLGLTIS